MTVQEGVVRESGSGGVGTCSSCSSPSGGGKPPWAVSLPPTACTSGSQDPTSTTPTSATPTSACVVVDMEGVVKEEELEEDYELASHSQVCGSSVSSGMSSKSTDNLLHSANGSPSSPPC